MCILFSLGVEEIQSSSIVPVVANLLQTWDEIEIPVPWGKIAGKLLNMKRNIAIFYNVHKYEKSEN